MELFLHLRSMRPEPVVDMRGLPTYAEPRAFVAGERTSRNGKPIHNHILLALPEAEFELLRPALSFHELPANTSLHEPGHKLEFVHFLNRGLVSTVVTTKQGKTVEVGVVGNEGLVGTPAFVGLSQSPHRAIVQIAGDSFGISVAELQNILPSSPNLLHIASLHAVIQGMQAAQSAACNRLHAVEQRLARWLLIMQDRVNQHLLRVTHDFLAAMLGTDRPSVSLAAGILQKKGTIEYTRGTVRVVNHKRLEETACECYTVMQQFNEVLGIR